jgi:DNA-binding response OmpR family regulator
MATRIMVVDDEQAIGKLLIYQLRGFGYQVSYVSDGMLALRHFVLEQPDLVLLDVMMPQISGWEVCRQIRACSAAPVIMLTAKGADADIITGLNAGADDYITKPFSMVQLQARIETVLRRSDGAYAAQKTPRTLPRRDTLLAGAAVRSRARALAASQQQDPPAGTPPPAAPSRRLGQRLREARQSRGLSLHQVERACQVRWEFLQAIEQENFDYVPRVQLRRALKVYSEYLNQDLRDLVERPRPAPVHSQIMPHFAIIMALMVVVIAVGLYLL